MHSRLWLTLSLLLLLLAPRSQAAPPLSCAWPLETTGVGATNVAYPDTDATYWTMPFDSTTAAAMRISGRFPAARFMSFTAYDAEGGEAVALIDEDVVPATGSNPFTPQGAGGSGGTYTVTVVGPSGPPGANTLVLPTAVGWVLLRVYVPDEGLDRNGGVPLPQIVLEDADGEVRPLPLCPSNTAQTARVTP